MGPQELTELLELGERINAVQNRSLCTHEATNVSAIEFTAMCANWCTIEIPCPEDFYHRALHHTLHGTDFYTVWQNGYTATARGGVTDLSCLIQVLEGAITKTTEKGQFVYTPEKEKSLHIFDSAELATYEHNHTVINMLPLPVMKTHQLNKCVGDKYVSGSDFAEWVALASLPNGLEFVSTLLGREDVGSTGYRYTGIYSKVVSCLIERKYGLKQIAAETKIPAPTLAKLKFGNSSLMQFVEFYRYSQLTVKLKDRLPDIVASEEGFSSKYKMYEAMKRYHKNYSGIAV